MKLFLLIPLLFLITANNNQVEQKWGQIGHYVTGEIAEHYLTESAKKRVKEILGDKSIQTATVWMDDIRSDPAYDYTATWHWATIPDGMRYEDFEQEDDGDVIWALETLIKELEDGGLSEQEEREKLMLVMHMIGDIHQPLHVGTGEDRGGNDLRVQWMGQNSNLHRVWDSDIIRSLELSYTELARELILMADESKVFEWQNSTVRDWAYESVEVRDEVYDIPGNLRLSYDYRYYKKDLMFKRLLQAGVRMAGVLNQIYSDS